MSPGTPAAPGIAPVGASVLVVDDEALIRWSIREGLSESGYHVEEAGTAAEARAHIGQPLDAVVLDIRLPDADGLQLLKELRAGSQPPPVVIVISAYVTRDMREQAERDGAYALVGKPFDVDEITRLLDTALGERRAAASRI